MYAQPNQEDYSISDVPIPMKERTMFDDVPDLDDYTPVRETYLQGNKMDALTKQLPTTDRDMYQFEEYLRNKWGCNDAIPESFDPDKLEALLRSRLPTRHKQEKSSETREQTQEPVLWPEDDAPGTAATEPQAMPLKDTSPPSPNSIYSCGCSASCESLSTGSVTGLLDTDGQIGDYDSEALTSDDEISTEDIAQARERSNSNTASSRGRTASETPRRPSTPRIRAGSRPPLSRSAFVEGGVPCVEKRCRGQCKRGVVVRGRVKPPVYFPFKTRVARSSSRRNRPKQ
ncbi:hypothetical protein F4824DRAFT_498316 [Ustulina deusta]|nr:hypothetical protein F4824DRAFT_498316 [Ustulina deusta]